METTVRQCTERKKKGKFSVATCDLGEDDAMLPLIDHESDNLLELVSNKYDSEDKDDTGDNYGRDDKDDTVVLTDSVDDDSRE
eukprot:5984617-Ditylum_brightwellii.AAC.1